MVAHRLVRSISSTAAPTRRTVAIYELVRMTTALRELILALTTLEAIVRVTQ